MDFWEVHVFPYHQINLDVFTIKKVKQKMAKYQKTLSEIGILMDKLYKLGWRQGRFGNMGIGNFGSRRYIISFTCKKYL